MSKPNGKNLRDNRDNSREHRATKVEKHEINDETRFAHARHDDRCDF